MFEDEMTEEHLAKTADDYFRVTQNEQQVEHLAIANAYIHALEAMIACLKRRERIQAVALFGMQRFD